jgi:hypothetical protein
MNGTRILGTEHSLMVSALASSVIAAYEGLSPASRFIIPNLRLYLLKTAKFGISTSALLLLLKLSGFP